MPEYLPERVSGSRAISPMRRAQVARRRGRAEMNVVRHGIDMWEMTEKDQIDSEATGCAITYALNREFRLYKEAIAEASDSETMQELLATKLALFSALSNARIYRRFSR